MPFASKLLLFFWSPLAMVPLMLVLSEVRVPQPLPYHWHKTLHVLGAVVFLGNLVTQIVWMGAANRSKTPTIVRAALQTLSTTDLLFMGPGMFLLIANGAILAQAWGGLYRWSWMLTALLLFGVWGLISVPLTLIQLKMLKVVETTPDDKLVDALGQPPKLLGTLTVLMVAIPVVILGLMVLKPRLW